MVIVADIQTEALYLPSGYVEANTSAEVVYGGCGLTYRIMYNMLRGHECAIDEPFWLQGQTLWPRCHFTISQSISFTYMGLMHNA